MNKIMKSISYSYYYTKSITPILEDLIPSCLIIIVSACLFVYYKSVWMQTQHLLLLLHVMSILSDKKNYVYNI